MSDENDLLWNLDELDGVHLKIGEMVNSFILEVSDLYTPQEMQCFERGLRWGAFGALKLSRQEVWEDIKTVINREFYKNV